LYKPHPSASAAVPVNGGEEPGTRGQAVAMPTEVRPEFKHIEKYNIVSVSGEWALNRNGVGVVWFH